MKVRFKIDLGAKVAEALRSPQMSEEANSLIQDLLFKSPSDCLIEFDSETMSLKLIPKDPFWLDRPDLMGFWWIKYPTALGPMGVAYLDNVNNITFRGVTQPLDQFLNKYSMVTFQKAQEPRYK